jgi:hypothetical protein
MVVYSFITATVIERESPMTIDKTWRLLFFLALAFTLFMTLQPEPPHLIFEVLGDKAEHGIAFGGMALLARLGFRKAPDWLIFERLSFIGALIEVIQAIPSVHRDCDWKDWVADSIGVAVSLWLIARLRLRERLESHLAGPQHD